MCVLCVCGYARWLSELFLANFALYTMSKSHFGTRIKSQSSFHIKSPFVYVRLLMEADLTIIFIGCRFAIEKLAFLMFRIISHILSTDAATNIRSDCKIVNFICVVRHRRLSPMRFMSHEFYERCVFCVVWAGVCMCVLATLLWLSSVYFPWT